MSKILGAKQAAAFLLFSCLLFSGKAFACPCRDIKMPEKPQISLEEGLKYSETDDSSKEFQAVVNAARQACQMHVGEPMVAVVSDLDETLFDNRKEYRRHPDMVSSDHKDWVNEASAPVLKPVADFLAWARQNGFAIFFISGRTEEKRLATIENLIKDNVSYDGLYLRPLNDKRSPEEIKIAARKQIEDMGFKVIVNIGDQYSDLVGGFAEDCEKLPNRMYFIK